MLLMAALLLAQGSPMDRALADAELHWQKIDAARKESARASFEALRRGMTEEAPACATAWNDWIGNMKSSAHFRDYQDAKRFHAARKACQKALKSLEGFYGKTDR